MASRRSSSVSQRGSTRWSKNRSLQNAALLRQPSGTEDSTSRASGWEVEITRARLSVTEGNVREVPLECGGTNSWSVAKYGEGGVPGESRVQGQI